MGDKEKKVATDFINETCCVDFAELEGDESTGCDVAYETKVASYLTKKRAATDDVGGRPPRLNAKGEPVSGAPAAVGHKFAFGSTEEFYRLTILGCRQRGRPRDGTFDHNTGRGYVAPARGSYDDALRVKRIKVVPMIVETAGGVTPQFVAQVGRLSRRAASKSGRDSTKYGTSRTSTTGFFHHHIERIGASAQRGDAIHILNQITARKQLHMGRVASSTHAP